MCTWGGNPSRTIPKGLGVEETSLVRIGSVTAAKRSKPSTPRAVLTRDRITQAAKEQVLIVGIDGLSLREVARSLGVTGAALYAHVDGKPGLVAAIASDCFDGLAQRFDTIDVNDPIERIRAQCRAYVDHALAAPPLYEVMMRFAPALPSSTAGETVTPGEPFGPATRVFGDAMTAANDAFEQGLLAASDPLVCAFILWAGIHGLVETLTMGFGFPSEFSDQLIDSMIDALIRGLSTKPADTRSK